MRLPSPTMTVSYAGILALIATGAAAAAPAEKVTLCHWDTEAGVHVALEVPGKAADNHLREHEHDGVVGQGMGEGCVVEVAVPALASATAAGGSVLVARLLDSDLSGTVSVGDTVEVGSIPTSFDGGSPVGTSAGPVAVDAVLQDDGRSVQVRAGGGTYLWSIDDGGSGTEVYMESGSSGTTALVDAREVTHLYDVLMVQTGSPSGPVSGWLEFTRSAADDAFVDVVLTNS